MAKELNNIAKAKKIRTTKSLFGSLAIFLKFIKFL